jgi:hypothetical protein
MTQDGSNEHVGFIKRKELLGKLQKELPVSQFREFRELFSTPNGLKRV